MSAAVLGAVPKVGHALLHCLAFAGLFCLYWIHDERLDPANRRPAVAAVVAALAFLALAASDMGYPVWLGMFGVLGVAIALLAPIGLFDESRPPEDAPDDDPSDVIPMGQAPTYGPSGLEPTLGEPEP